MAMTLVSGRSLSIQPLRKASRIPPTLAELSRGLTPPERHRYSYLRLCQYSIRSLASQSLSSPEDCHISNLSKFQSKATVRVFRFKALPLEAGLVYSQYAWKGLWYFFGPFRSGATTQESTAIGRSRYSLSHIS